MSEKATAQVPTTTLRVLYVTTAGREIVKVTPDKDTIKVGDSTAECSHRHIFPSGKAGGKFDAIYIEGRSQCVPVYGDNKELSPEWIDALAHTNLAKALHELASGGKKEKVAWTPIIMNGLLIIAIVAVGFVLHGDVTDMQEDLVASHPSLQTPAEQAENNGDTIVVGQNGANG